MQTQPIRLDRPTLTGRVPFAVALLLLTTVCATGFAPATPAASPKESAAQAAQLYEAGDFAAALPLLEKAVASGKADGATMYRLYFVQRQVGQDAEAVATLPKALEQLEAEVKKGKASLEATFYLANGYASVAKLSERNRIAQLATERVESGKWGEIDKATDQFRVGKLYQDLEKDAEAKAWFDRAVDGLDPKHPTQSAYSQWARRFLAEKARESGDDEALLAHSVALMDDPTMSQQDLDQLAIQLVGALRYRDAAKAWSQAVLRSPATANRSRYANRVAITASTLAPLPTEAPDGRLWNELSRAELEQVMVDQVNGVRAIQRGYLQMEEPARQAMTASERQGRNDEIGVFRPTFTAAALEYLVRGFPLRETSFQAGYATMIFRDAEWRLPAEKKNRRRGAK